MLKRVLLGIVASVGLLVVAAGIGMASIFMGNEPMPASGPIAGGKAFLLNDGYVAAFAVPTVDQHVALIDCGNDIEAGAVLGFLQAQRFVVDGVFLTHAHPDHTNGCGAIKKAFPDAFFAASGLELPTLTGKAAFKGLLTGMSGATDSGVVVTRVLGDGDETVVGGVTIKAFAVPGHTAGSMMYLADGVLFVGDAATGAADGHIKAPPRPFTDDLVQAVASLHALATTLRSTTVNTFAFAHSGPMPADLQKLVAIQ